MRRLFALMFVTAAVLAAGVSVVNAANDRPAADAQQPVVTNNAEVAITVKALNYAFEPAVVTVATGDVVTITFNNEDGGVDHNIEVGKLFATPECNGPCTLYVTFTAPGPGEYQLLCITHPDMVGTLKVN